MDRNDISIDGFYESSSECPSVKYQKISESKVLKRKKFNFVEQQFNAKQKNMLANAIEQYETCNIPENFVIEMSNGKIFLKQSDQTYFITEDNKILADMLVNNGPKLSTNEWPDAIDIADNILVLSSCWGGNFYHWLTWTVSRLHMLNEAGYKLNNFDKVIVNYAGFKFQNELLKMLDIPKYKIIGTISDGGFLKAKKIVTASIPDFTVTPEVITQSLRKFFLKNEYINENFPKKIYLSRNKSKARFVVNEEELITFLSNFDFVTIYAEDLTFAEQVKYFANADVIISQHGAGLTNIAFCKAKTKIIEIYNENIKDYVDLSFCQISDNLNLSHYFMFGEAEGNGPNANMHVDMDKLQEIFEIAELKTPDLAAP